MLDAELTLSEVFAWDPVVAAVARQEPEWQPGTAHGYHARTFGWIIGELVRRITGVTLGQFFATEIAAPLGLDFWIGLPADHEPRVATLYPPEPQAMATDPASGSLLRRAMSGPSDLFGLNDMWNRRDIHGAEMPSSNGIGTAHALARLYAATGSEVDGTAVGVSTYRLACSMRRMRPPRRKRRRSSACRRSPGDVARLGERPHRSAEPVIKLLEQRRGGNGKPNIARQFTSHFFTPVEESPA
jgi:CubicO group peptidase (beta-lactamase class C family)